MAAARSRPQAPSGPNQVWSYDFVFDHCANGQQLKCLTVTDEFTKEGLAIDVNARIRSPRVIDVLSRLVSARGAPSFLRSDNGPEFVSKALLSWIVAQGIGTALIEPGNPWQNGVAESFNGKFRGECLNLEWLRSRAEAKVIIETWRRHYNEVRPHSSLAYLTPNEFVTRLPKAASRHATGQRQRTKAARPLASCFPPRNRRSCRIGSCRRVCRRQLGEEHIDHGIRNSDPVIEHSDRQPTGADQTHEFAPTAANSPTRFACRKQWRLRVTHLHFSFMIFCTHKKCWPQQNRQTLKSLNK